MRVRLNVLCHYFIDERMLIQYDGVGTDVACDSKPKEEGRRFISSELEFSCERLHKAIVVVPAGFREHATCIINVYEHTKATILV